MEYLIAAVIIIAILYCLIVYVILPLSKVAAIISITCGGLYALYVSILSFFSSVEQNKDPYKTYVDKNPNKPDGVRRNYFFGPGFHQISKITSGAFDNLNNYRRKLNEWKDTAIQHNWLIDIWIYLGYIFAIISSQILALIFVIVFSIIMSVIILVGIIIFYVFFSLLWIIDRTVLLLKSIRSRCPHCKRISIIPVFICPTCGLEHKHLVPGPYGVLKRKCACGTMLSTTFINGRSKYSALCPYCDHELYSSSSIQYGIQLVGGIGTGKTTFLAAFLHEYKKWLISSQNIVCRENPVDAFAELEDWFQTGKAESTSEKNASMYSIIHNSDKNTSIQMTIYDISGETFSYAESDLQQQQLKYCEGFLMVIDPTMAPELISISITNFINSINEMKKGKTSKLSEVPVAIIITKADLYKTELGLPEIRTSYINSGKNIDFQQYQNDVCRSFLLRHGYNMPINLIASEFSDICYFPVSAMGHNLSMHQYEPWGVLEPVFWLMNHENCPLKSIITGQNGSGNNNRKSFITILKYCLISVALIITALFIVYLIQFNNKIEDPNPSIDQIVETLMNPTQNYSTVENIDRNMREETIDLTPTTIITKNHQLGELVTIGKYITKNDYTIEPLQWYVIYADESSTVLLSKKIIARGPYDYSGNTVPLEQSFIYTWLNGGFKNDSLSEIVSKCPLSLRLLRVDEAYNIRSFIPLNGEATEYALMNGTFYERNQNYVPWLTQTFSTSGNRIVTINSDGAIDEYGITADTGCGIRPVLELNCTIDDLL